MNTLQNEQLFTDLAPEQAEIISAATRSSLAEDSFGLAQAHIKRTGSRSFNVSTLFVLDRAMDGLTIYARIQGEATDGSSMITPTNRLANFNGITYSNLKGSFSKPIKRLRVLLFRGNLPGTPGNSLTFITRGNWVDGL